MSDSHQYYLQDSVALIIEKSLNAKHDAEMSKSDYDTGRLMTYYEVLSMLQQQAKAFGISLTELGLDKIEPDKDLL